MTDLYAQRMIDLARNLPKPLPLIGANARATAHAKMCGSIIEIELIINEQAQLVDIAGNIDACALGKAATGIVMNNIQALRLPEIQQAHKWLQMILKGETPTLPTKWQDLEIFAAAKDIPLRHASCCLIFKALEKAFEGYKP